MLSFVCPSGAALYMMLTTTPPSWTIIVRLSIAATAFDLDPLPTTLVADVGVGIGANWKLLPATAALDTRAGIYYLAATNASDMNASASVLGWSTQERNDYPTVTPLPTDVTLCVQYLLPCWVFLVSFMLFIVHVFRFFLLQSMCRHSIIFMPTLDAPGILALTQRRAIPRLIDLLGTVKGVFLPQYTFEVCTRYFPQFIFVCFLFWWWWCGGVVYVCVCVWGGGGGGLS